MIWHRDNRLVKIAGVELFVVHQAIRLVWTGATSTVSNSTTATSHTPITPLTLTGQHIHRHTRHLRQCKQQGWSQNTIKGVLETTWKLGSAFYWDQWDHLVYTVIELYTVPNNSFFRCGLIQGFFCQRPLAEADTPDMPAHQKCQCTHSPPQ